jgi:hypothetical protein
MGYKTDTQQRRLAEQRVGLNDKPNGFFLSD